MSKLTKAQRELIIRMGFVSNVLRNGDEGSPKWWIEGGEAVRANVAESLVRHGFVSFTQHYGGQPGVLGYTISPAGRAALTQEAGE